MQKILAMLCLSALLLSGCTLQGDKIYNTYNYPGDSTGMVRVLDPAPGTVFQANFDWVEGQNPDYYWCDWGYYREDTSFTALVRAYVPGDVRSAQVYADFSGNGHFNPYGQVVHPVADSFRVPIYAQPSYYASVGDTDFVTFYVEVTTTDGANYLSRNVPFEVFFGLATPIHTAPDAPAVDTLVEQNYNGLVVRWCSRSPLVDHFITFLYSSGNGQTMVDTLSQRPWQTNFLQYLPLANYSFWMKAINSYGVSPASDTLHITTLPPATPTDLEAWVHSGTIVELHWYNHNSGPDSVLIARRDTVSAFSTIRSLPIYNTGSPPYQYTDSTAVSHNVYFYKIGIQFVTGTWWSADSAGVWVP